MRLSWLVCGIYIVCQVLQDISLKQEVNMRSCAVCKSTDTYPVMRQSGNYYPVWYLNKPEGVLCGKCYGRLYRNPKWNPINNRKNSPRMIRFTPTGRLHLLKENPRTGICSKCFRSKARGEIKLTAMHHTSYDPNDVLANTVELCVRCHTQIHHKVRM